MKHSLRSTTTGRFIKATQIVNGRLYGYKGSIVRARGAISNGQRVVSIHNKLFGVVNDVDLNPINHKQVAEYLTHADNQDR